jgi:hypothetical protein
VQERAPRAYEQSTNKNDLIPCILLLHSVLLVTRLPRTRLPCPVPPAHRVIIRVLGLGFVRYRCMTVTSVAPLLFGYLVALAILKRHCCRGISSPDFFRSPVVIYSDVNGEARETYSGVRGRRIFVFFS